MKCFVLLLCLLPSALYSQSLHIREIRFRPNPKYYNTTDTTIVYPIIITGNQAIDRSINEQVKEKVIESTREIHTITAREGLREMIKTGLTDLDYEITCNKNGILSFTIDIQAEAAYPTQWQKYFNFDIRTGKDLGIRDIISEVTFEKFKAKVFADKVDSLNYFKENELKGLLLSKEIDTTDFQWATETVGDCINSISIDNFSLSPSGVEIFDQCEFSHVIRAIEPTYELKYSYEFLSPYLRPAVQRRLPTAKSPLNLSNTPHSP